MKEEDAFIILKDLNLKHICDYYEATITREIKYFCCKTCANAYVERYKKLKSMLNRKV